MTINNTIQRILKIKLIATILFLSVSAYAEVIVTEVAVATPQNDDEIGNTEILKERALKNAIEAALLKHSGAIISNQRLDGSRSKEEITIKGKEVDDKVISGRNYNRSTHVQTTGQAKIVEILSEGFVGNDYQIEVKLAITNKSDNLKKINAGYFWERAGKPTIAINLIEESGGYGKSMAQSTSSYIYDNFSKNGINLADVAGPKYRLDVKQLFNTNELQEYNTFTTHCQLIFEVIDNGSTNIIFTEKSRHGPVAGFTVEQAHKNCIASIIPGTTKSVIMKFAEIFDANWREGSFYHVSIQLISGEQVSEALEAIKSTFSLENYQNMQYSQNLLSLEVQFKGDSQGLISSLESSFDYTSCELMLQASNDDEVEFVCRSNIN